ncbi:RNA polymerase sigma factor [Streptomyces sp. L7]
MEISLRARVRAGDPDAFGRLFDEHASVVHRHAVRMTGDRGTADDIVSLTFLEAWRLRERVLPGDDSLRPWLLGIATNVTRNTARAARRHRAALVGIPPPDPVPDFADEVTRRMADTEELAAAQSGVEQAAPGRAGGVHALRVGRGWTRPRPPRPCGRGRRHRTVPALPREEAPAQAHRPRTRTGTEAEAEATGTGNATPGAGRTVTG